MHKVNTFCDVALETAVASLQQLLLVIVGARNDIVRLFGSLGLLVSCQYRMPHI